MSMQMPTYSKLIDPDVIQIESRRYRTPSGGRGPRLLWLLCAEFSESMCPELPLAEALPVRLRT